MGLSRCVVAEAFRSRICRDDSFFAGLFPRSKRVNCSDWKDDSQTDLLEKEMKQRVLILCTGNSARSQMAEGLLAHDGADRFEVESAGTKPGRVRPEAFAVMKELGIDISDHRSKHVDEFQGQ